MTRFISLHSKFQLTDLFLALELTVFTPLQEEKVENLVYKEEPLILEVIVFINLVDTVLQCLKQAVPGPGNYNPKTDLDKVGRYTLSKFRYSRIIF